MDDQDGLARQFQQHRTQLRAVAYRMLGSFAEADDAVQEAWLRLSRSDAAAIDNLGGWLTTVVGRVCLDLLRTRRSRREEPMDGHIPDPVVSAVSGPDPEQQALIADAVGLALLVVLESLAPAERLAFVLHDMFAVPFDDIAAIVGRSTDATKQLASRARRRVQGSAPAAETDPQRQREVVDAFLAAARNGDFQALLAVLDPDVELRAETGPGAASRRLVRGAEAVASQALLFARLGQVGVPALVNGLPGVVNAPGGTPAAVMGVIVRDGRIVRIDILADRARLAALDLADFRSN